MHGDELDLEDMITANQAAQLAKATLRSVYRWIHTGRVRAWKRAGHFFVCRADVLRMFERVRVPPNGREANAEARRLADQRRRSHEEAVRRLRERGIV